MIKKDQKNLVFFFIFPNFVSMKMKCIILLNQRFLNIKKRDTFSF